MGVMGGEGGGGYVEEGGRGGLLKRGVGEGC